MRTGAWTDEKSTVMGILEPSSTLSPMMDNAKSEYGKNRNPLSISCCGSGVRWCSSLLSLAPGTQSTVVAVQLAGVVQPGMGAQTVPSDLETKKQSNFRPHSPQCAKFSDWKRPPDSNRSIPSLQGRGCTVHCALFLRTSYCTVFALGRHSRPALTLTALKSCFSGDQPIRGSNRVWGYAHPSLTLH